MKLSDFEEVEELVAERNAIGSFLITNEKYREPHDSIGIRCGYQTHNLEGDLADQVMADIVVKQRAEAAKIDARLAELGVVIDAPLIPEDEYEDDEEFGDDDEEVPQ